MPQKRFKHMFLVESIKAFRWAADFTDIPSRVSTFVIYRIFLVIHGEFLLAECLMFKRMTLANYDGNWKISNAVTLALYLLFSLL